jgi:hypothetical protein
MCTRGECKSLMLGKTIWQRRPSAMSPVLPVALKEGPIVCPKQENLCILFIPVTRRPPGSTLSRQGRDARRLLVRAGTCRRRQTSFPTT